MEAVVAADDIRILHYFDDKCLHDDIAVSTVVVWQIVAYDHRLASNSIGNFRAHFDILLSTRL